MRKNASLLTCCKDVEYEITMAVDKILTVDLNLHPLANNEIN